MAREVQPDGADPVASKKVPTKAEKEKLVQAYAGPNAAYYAQQFTRISRLGFAGLSPNWAAMLGGPIWAAARNLWGLYGCVALGDMIGLIVLGRSLGGPIPVGAPMGPIHSMALVPGLLLLATFHAVTGLLANWAYHKRFLRWRGDRSLTTGFSQKGMLGGVLLMIAIYPLTIYRFTTTEVVPFIEKFPTTRVIKLTTAKGMENGVEWMINHMQGFFDSIAMAIRTVLNFIELLFVGTPWPVTFLVIVLVAWRLSGHKVALFSAVSLLYVGLFGFWERAMATFSLVGSAAFICILLGTPLGICCAKNRRLYTIVRPVLDAMQTVPSFVYLIPAVAFFSIGNAPGILATLVFAMPPMIRLTALGIMQVPNSVREAALAFGASPLQLLLKVELPLAVPSIMTGMNQSIMMSLSMVVVAALIGAGGLGYDVLFALQHVETGKGVLAGVAIALLAMVLDRIVQGPHRDLP